MNLNPYGCNQLRFLSRACLNVRNNIIGSRVAHW
ncbi:hypothetical protein LINGRAHAP2_LOCUS5883 [Linum grandiflorum]